MQIKIERPVLEVLDAASVNGNLLVLNGTLDRKLYADVNKVLEAIGGKWNRKAKAHVFDEPVRDMLDAILESGAYSRVKQDLGQFDSPTGVVEKIIRMAGPLALRVVLEPQAGVGNIALAALKAGAAAVDCYEVDMKRAMKIGARLDGFGSSSVAVTDFLAVEPEPVYDAVLMNPPFAGQADIDHVLHAAKFLNAGGRLVSVMSAGTMFRSNRKAVEFRVFVEERGGRFELLPDGSFEESGTSVSACIVVL